MTVVVAATVATLNEGAMESGARNVLIAAVLTFVTTLLLFSVGILGSFLTDPESLKIIEYLSLTQHLYDFSRGIVDTRPMVFYASLTAICLFLTGRVVASPRWRA